MALDWIKCPYCEAAKNAGERTQMSATAMNATRASTPSSTMGPGTTRINQPDDFSATASDAPVSTHRASGGRRETRVDLPSDAGAEPVSMSAAQSGGGRRSATRVLYTDETESAQAPRRAADRGRRLTGIVVTFSWSALGTLFELHEGRNYVGSDVVNVEGNRPADVQVPEDDQLSSAHFLILCQREKYRISDCNSTNGTYVNGAQIDTLGIDLPDGALIQAGATLFTFQKVRPPSTGRVQPMEPEPSPEEPPPVRDRTDEDRTN